MRVRRQIPLALAALSAVLAVVRVASAQDAGSAVAPPPPPPGDETTQAATSGTDAASSSADAASDGGTTRASASDGGDEACSGPRVIGVRFRGLRRVASEDIRSAVNVREGGCYVRSALSRDARAIWDLGFFSDVQVAAEPSQGGVEVRFIVVERPSIHEIRFQGNENLEDDRIREGIELRDGSVLNENAIRRAVQRIRDLYSEKGYFLAEIRTETVRRAGDEDSNEVDVIFRMRENAQVQVRSIQFVGNSNIPTDELRGVMTTSTANLLSFLTSQGNYREEAFRNDIDLLHAAYYDRGYLNVEITNPRVALSPDRRFLDITIFVREGRRYRLGRVRAFELDDDDHEIEPYGGRRHLRDMLHVNPGDWFSRTTIGRDILATQTYYRDHGYATVEVTPDIQPHRDRDVVDLGLRIRRGPLTTVHRIVIRGNVRTADRVIRRELMLMEGDRYSETLYQRSRQRAMALGFFERVDMSTESVEGHPDRIVVNVEVAERPTGTFQVGAGFSSIESFIATAQIQQLNLFGRGQSLTFQAQLSGLRQIFALRFVEPYLLNSNWTFAVDVYNSVRAYVDFSRGSTGGSLTLGYPLIGTNDLRLFFTYTGEYVTTSTSSFGTIFGQNTIQSAFRQLPISNAFRNGWTSAFGVALAVDTRDNRLFPTSGIFARLGVDIADPVTGSENIYTRWSGFFRFYVPITTGVVLKANVTGGWISSRSPDGVPLYERFFLGGILDVRGYRLRTIGPRLVTNSQLDPNSSLIGTGANIGGNLQFYYNLEFEFPIITQVGIRGVVFTDGGNVWNTESRWCNGSGRVQVADVINPCSFNPLLLRTSWGVGLRWFSPLGLLRFEWGFPFAPLPYEETNVFEFTIGNFF